MDDVPSHSKSSTLSFICSEGLIIINTQQILKYLVN